LHAYGIMASQVISIIFYPTFQVNFFFLNYEL
jgi:hypothetical protein